MNQGDSTLHFQWIWHCETCSSILVEVGGLIMQNIYRCFGKFIQTQKMYTERWHKTSAAHELHGFEEILAAVHQLYQQTAWQYHSAIVCEIQCPHGKCVDV